jgi:hypothetical protein
VSEELRMTMAGPTNLLMIPTGLTVNEVDGIGGIAGNDRHYRTVSLHEKGRGDEGMEKKVFYFEEGRNIDFLHLPIGCQMIDNTLPHSAPGKLLQPCSDWSKFGCQIPDGREFGICGQFSRKRILSYLIIKLFV